VGQEGAQNGLMSIALLQYLTGRGLLHEAPALPTK
jgi:hypothetical protein